MEKKHVSQLLYISRLDSLVITSKQNTYQGDSYKATMLFGLLFEQSLILYFYKRGDTACYNFYVAWEYVECQGELQGAVLVVLKTTFRHCTMLVRLRLRILCKPLKMGD